MHTTSFRTCAISVVLLGALAGANAGGAAAATPEAQATQGSQAAVWTPKTLDFTYYGFTTTYSCDGLHDEVKNALLQFGARKDLVVQQTGCVGMSGSPTPFPGVRVKMSVLQPADAAKHGSDGQVPVNAHWKTVQLKLNQEYTASAPGTCELVEQIKQKILPLFTARNVKFRATCVPHQSSPTGPLLQAEVLVADEKAVASTQP